MAQGKHTVAIVPLYQTSRLPVLVLDFETYNPKDLQLHTSLDAIIISHQ